ncbi:hypothetical protein KEJ21_01230 [Candidatus Bathyarchaeota archaeon]|nr:hypothetical protein [Candidatus Bathyarchaeota archaeon]MBS7630212.1 hypothetical protein [Candidatus Bathyarchaeota archaeon]
MKEIISPPIRQVKREVRTLGIAIRKRILGEGFNIVGVVFRGNSLLDGVMKSITKGTDLIPDVVNMILSSPHYEQVRIIILEHPISYEAESLDPLRLAQSVKKPVLILSFNINPPLLWEGATHFQIKKEETILNITSLGLKPRTAERVIKMASRLDEALPECLRVANLILDSLACCE